MINRVTTYIDTAVVGSVAQIQHNLGGMVYPFIYTINGFGHKVAVSLYDARLAEVKALDDNTYQITFASAFAGFLDLLFFDVKTPSQGKRITALEKDMVDVQALFSSHTNLLQWKQMNTYLEKQIADQSVLIADLQVQINTLSNDVSAL